MSSISLVDLEGKWIGTYRLQVSPDAPVRESQSTATIAPVAGGRFGTLHYTWSDHGQAQDGMLLVASAAGKGPADIVWVDSWHMGDVAMLCSNDPGGDDIVNGLGSYAAPPGPDWGWRTVIRSESRDAFQLLMYNITPDGEEDLGVEVTYTRRT